jgi:Tol biopolymer transport system component
VALASAIISTPCVAKITFANVAATILMPQVNAQLCVRNPAKVTGWGQRSIVEAYGNNQSSTWPEGYTSGSIVGQAGLTGVTLPTRTDLVDANSNAIIPLATNTLLRTTSNLLLYTARTDSSSLWVLRSRADSTNLNVRYTSEAANQVYQLTVPPSANSIDGSVWLRYCLNNYVFHNNGNAWTVRGWVRFNNGFTVMPRASVIMDTLVTVSGGMDLRDTGTLILNNDLYLAHNVTLTDGGNIKGKSSTTPGAGANTIFMGGDLTLASTTYARTLHITGDWSKTGTSGDLVIDGGGHTLNIGDRAQIFVDQNVTLTLRNMTIKTGPKSLFKPAIQLASPGSKLALDNVMLDLGTDFKFVQGQIFIHDEVAVTGTSAFVYQSPMPSFITSGATWSFEQDTTFSVAPATFTDQPYIAGSATTNNFIVHADATAALYLNNCSFLTTFTGLRLRTGMVLFDNRVVVNTQAGVALNNSTPVATVGLPASTGNQPSVVSWSPDGRFLAVVNVTSPYGLQVYSFNGNSTATPVGGAAAVGTVPQGLSWSPDGRFLAVVNNVVSPNNFLWVYSFNGNSTPTLVGGPVSTGYNYPYYVSWSPDGRFLALVNSTSSGNIQVYRFNGIGAPTLLGTSSYVENTPYGIAWSPDGRFLAVVGESIAVNVYRFNGSGAPVLAFSKPTGGSVPFAVAWSPDGRFIAAVDVNNSTLQIFSFNGSSNPVLLGAAVSTGSGTRPTSVTFSPDGRFVAVALSAASYGLQIYNVQVNGSPILIGSTVTTNMNVSFSVAWSPDGRFLAVTNNGLTGNYSNSLQIFQCNYYYTGQPPQAFTNGLLFGNKALGSAYDADVQVWGNSTVTIKGMVRDDSA